MSYAPESTLTAAVPDRRIPVLGKALCLTLLTLACYWPALRGEFVFDDIEYICNNKLLESSAGLGKIWFSTEQVDYWPVSYTAFWLERRAFGDDTLGYHLVNAALHVLVSLLAWRVLHRLQIPGAFLAALIFAVHPVNVESAAWIFQQKTTLAAAFCFASLAAWLQFQADGRRRWLWTSLLLFALAMLSKTSAVMLPVSLLVLVWGQRGRISRRDLLAASPFFAAALAIGLVSLWFQQKVSLNEDFVRPDGLGERLALAGWTPWFYLGKALWPQSLAFVYPRWHADPASPWPWLPGAAIALVALAGWRACATWGRPLLVAGGCYLLALFPVLGLIGISYMRYSLVADHWQYLALIVPIASVVAAVALAARRLPLPARRFAGAGAIAIVGILAVLSWRQAGIYRDDISLWTDCIAKNPSAWLAHNNLGRAILKRDGDSATEACYRTALQLDPENTDIRQNLAWSLMRQQKTEEACQLFREAVAQRPSRAKLHFGLGCALAKLDRYAEAERSLASAIELNYAGGAAYEQLGDVLRRLGTPYRAEECYRRALAIDPASPAALVGLALLSVDRADYSQAEKHLQAALAAHPQHVQAHLQLANLRGAQGRAAEAVDVLRAAVKASPDAAELHAALGERLAARGEQAEALAQLERAASLNPRLAETHAALAEQHARQGQSAAAIDCYRVALDLDPGLHEARRALADLLAGEGEVAAAIAEYRIALAAKPEWPAAAANLAFLLLSQPGAGETEAREALRWAREACRQTSDGHPVALDTLAAACAALGRFDDAVVAAEKARDRARAMNRAAFAAEVEQRLHTYHARRTASGVKVE